MSVKLAIIDSGIGAQLDAAVLARVALRLTEDGHVACVAESAVDGGGHGTAVASLVVARAPHCSLLSAQVFFSTQPSAARVVASAIDWCVAQGARVVNLSLGLHDDRRSLRDSCFGAVAQGVLLVASHPARGAPVYPALYPGVLAVNGDARCGEDDCSRIAPDVFGASPLPPPGFCGGGASYAAARMTGRAGAFFKTFPAATAADFKNHLQVVARFHGRETRSAVV